MSTWLIILGALLLLGALNVLLWCLRHGWRVLLVAALLYGTYTVLGVVGAFVAGIAALALWHLVRGARLDRELPELTELEGPVDDDELATSSTDRRTELRVIKGGRP